MRYFSEKNKKINKIERYGTKKFRLVLYLILKQGNGQNEGTTS